MIVYRQYNCAQVAIKYFGNVEKKKNHLVAKI